MQNVNQIVFYSLRLERLSCWSRKPVRLPLDYGPVDFRFIYNTTAKTLLVSFSLYSWASLKALLFITAYLLKVKAKSSN